MWKQKQWKYKNAAPKVPKKEEWTKGISAARLMQTSSNYIKAGCSYMAFNVDSTGSGSVGILPLEDNNTKATAVPILNAHTDFVSDMDFSPHTDSCIATASFDGTAKLWKIACDAVGGMTFDLCASFPDLEKRVECILWHPYVSNLVTIAASKTVQLYDTANALEAVSDLEGHTDGIQSIAWSQDGSCLASTCKDKVVRIFDPRLPSVAGPTREAQGHQNLKDSRVVWLDDNHLITTGFDQMWTREMSMYDSRAFKTAISTISVDNSNGTLMPFYDGDTGMLFLAGKGDNNLRFYEVSAQAPYFSEAGCDSIVQVKGAALVPKRAVNIVDVEVNRLLILTSNSVVPVSYVVPRKKSSDFHEDIFPETYSGLPVWNIDEWRAFEVREIPKISLRLLSKKHLKSEINATEKSNVTTTAEKKEVTSPTVKHDVTLQQQPQYSLQRTILPDSHGHAGSDDACLKDVSHSKEQFTSQKQLAASVLNARHGKFKNFKGTALHRSLYVENLMGLSNRVPAESDGFAANPERCAVMLNGAGGPVAVIEFSRTGRLPNTGLPVLHHGSVVTDFAWDPFDGFRLACCCMDGTLKLWRIPPGGLVSTLECPELCINAHKERMYMIRFHPLAKDIIATASSDMTVKVWDLLLHEAVYVLEGHTDTVFSLAWSQDGCNIATYCKDRAIRIYDPRASTLPVQEYAGPSGIRGGRILWVLTDRFILVTGFNRQSARQIELYDAVQLSLSRCLSSVDVDVATSILVPFYDADSSIVFMTGRGDSTVFAFEIIAEPPYLLPLPSFIASGGLHQALCFLTKQKVDVGKVEFAKAYRLTATTIEPISFTVPRVKAEYFQDDLFPDTRVTWEPTLTAAEWLSGMTKQPRCVSLCTPGMIKLSEATTTSNVRNCGFPQPLDTECQHKTEEQKRTEIVNSMFGCLPDEGSIPLPQDLVEGVSPDEWDE